MTDRFDDITDAELIFGEDVWRERAKNFTVKAGVPGRLDSQGREYTEVNYLMQPLSMENCGFVRQVSKRECVEIIKDLFFAALDAHRWIYDHDVVEVRIWPEIDFQHNGRFAKFYARLSTYQSAELVAKRAAGMEAHKQVECPSDA